MAVDEESALALVRVLLKAGADVNLQDDLFGTTPLHLAAIADPPNPAVVKLLLDAGADRSLETKDGQDVDAFVDSGGVVDAGFLTFLKLLMVIGDAATDDG